MITAFIFLIHILFLLYIFRLKLKNESITSAFLNVSLIILVFAIGWSVTTMVAKWLFEQEGFGKFFNRDTISLFILTVLEFFFYRFYYKPDLYKKI